jgi:hypothetical protein
MFRGGRGFHALVQILVILGWVSLSRGRAAKVVTDASAAGAHWAFQPVQRTDPPAVPGVSGSIDRFIVARLAEAGLRMSPPTDRRAWLRRVTLDLTGLPPGEAAVARFVSDERPDARERVVEGLLAESAYGERWGRWWLDVARYADTNGQDENKVMANAWRYRDWVVWALNSDVPYDRFLMEQLAGDLLPSEGVEEHELFRRWTATGFLVLGPKLLAEQDKPKLVLDVVDEQVDTVGRAVLGLTLGCARCHDHKFDPVSQREYTALAGIFRSTRTMENLAFVSKFNERRVSTVAELALIERHGREGKEIAEGLKAATTAAEEVLKAGWDAALRRLLVEREGELDAEVSAGLRERLGKQLLKVPAMGPVLAGLKGDAGAVESAVIRWKKAGESGGLVPGWRGGAFAARGTNRMELPVPPGSEPVSWTMSVWVRRDGEKGSGETRRWLVSRGANEWEDGHLALVLDGGRPGAYLNTGGGREKVVSAWGKPDSVPVGSWRHLAATSDGRQLRVYLDGAEVGSAPVVEKAGPGQGPFVLGMRPDGYVGFRGRLDQVLIFGRVLDGAEVRNLASGGTVVGTWMARDFDPMTPEEEKALADGEASEFFWGADGLLEVADAGERRRLFSGETQVAVEGWEARQAEWKRREPAPAAHALAVVDDVVTNLPVMIRGSHLRPGPDPVPRGFPVLGGAIPATPPGAGTSGRLELARWLTHRSNPLTARVLVNRLWQAHFGEGLVRSPDNFGLRGELPSHPGLLDWLAWEFMASGWSVKHLHRLMVLSEAYGQSSAMTPEVAKAAEAVDPGNRLLHRYPRQRLEAEMLRDAILAVAGRLDRAVGGTLVDWKNDDYVPGDPAPFLSVRRALYLPVVRDRGEDLFTAFDGANASVCVARRGTTVVSPQALYLMNAPLMKESAEAMTRQLTEADAGKRLDQLYRKVLARAPRETERARARTFLEDARVGALAETERWTALAQVLLMSNEFTHRE